MKRLSALGLSLAVLIALALTIDARNAARHPVEPPPPAVDASPATAASPPSAEAELDGEKPTAEAKASPESAALAPLLAKTRAAFPKIADVRGHTAEELHDTPPEVLASARRFGELAEFLERNPTLVGEALPVYRDCATDGTVMPAIRALCSHRLGRYRNAWDPATREAYSRIPPEIRRLGDELPSD